MKVIIAKAYPSTECDETSYNGYRPMLTREDINKFGREVATSKSQIKLRYEHSSNPNDDLGYISKIWFDNHTKWMWMEAHVHDHKAHVVDNIVVDQQFRGVSLCYEIGNSNYKKLLELSLVKDPDFEKAKIVTCHGAKSDSLFIWPISETAGLPPINLMSLQYSEENANAFESQGVVVSGNTIVLPNEGLIEEAQAYAQFKNIQSPDIRIVDMSEIDKIDDLNILKNELKNAVAYSETMKKNPASAEDERYRAEAKQVVERSQKITDYITMNLTGDNPEANKIKEQLAMKMATQPELSRFGELAAMAMQKREAESSAQIKELQQQISRLEQTLKTNTRAEVMSHGRFSGSSNPYLTPQGIKSVWTRTTQQPKSLSSPSSSSSSSSSSLLAAPSSSMSQFKHSAKREREPSPDFPPNFSEYQYGDFSLYSGCVESSRDSDFSSRPSGVMVFAHSRDTPGQPDSNKRHCGILSKLTNASSHDDIVRGLALSAVRGERFTGLTPDIVENSAYTLAPDLFARLLVTCNGATPPTNANAGIFGYKDERFSPSILGFSGSIADEKFKMPYDQIGVSKF